MSNSKNKVFKPGQVYLTEKNKEPFVILYCSSPEGFERETIEESEEEVICEVKARNKDGYEWSTFYPEYDFNFFGYKLIAQYPTWQEAIKNDFKPNL
jgi:hypothetical protein